MPNIAILLALCVTEHASGNSVNPDTLCNRDEQVIFSCAFQIKTVSVCASSLLTKNKGYLQYRFGTKKNIEMRYPAEQRHTASIIFISSTTYAGGGETHLRFSAAPYDYIVYDRTISMIYAGTGERTPEFSAGVLVKKNGRTLRRLRCADAESASIGKSAYDILETETFKSLDD